MIRNISQLVLFMLIIFVFSTIKAYGVDNKYETIIKRELKIAQVPENFIDECKAEIIDSSKLLVDGKFNEKPSSLIKNFFERGYNYSIDDCYVTLENFEREINEFKNKINYTQMITTYNMPKTFHDDLKLSIAFLIFKLEGLEKDNIIKKIYKVLELLEYASEFLLGLQDMDNIETTSINTPLGKVAIGGITPDEYNEPYFLIIDFGGNDKYLGPVASSVSKEKFGIVLDLGGNDLYENKDTTRGAQGSGENGGIAVLFDYSGNDVYKSIKKSQGSGLIGGVGVLWDKAGKDCYYSFEYSQGFGGEILKSHPDQRTNEIVRKVSFVGGFGLLLDSEGDDIYNIGNLPYATSSQKTGIGNNYSQGAARNFNSFGMLIDLQGNDVYKANISAQGAGFIYGKGMLFDKQGDDLYFGIQYVQGAAAHGGTGVLFDKSGDDDYYITDSQGLGSGKDYAPPPSDFEFVQSEPQVAIFLDESGNDEYYFKGDSCGVGIDGGIGYFIDMNGEDVYKNSVMGKGFLLDKKFIDYKLNKLTLGLFYDHEGIDSYPKEAPITNHNFFIRKPNNSPGARLNPQGYQLGLLIDK